jgi:ParB-like chromosome segregation protein Spo0J
MTDTPIESEPDVSGDPELNAAAHTIRVLLDKAQQQRDAAADCLRKLLTTKFAGKKLNCARWYTGAVAQQNGLYVKHLSLYETGLIKLFAFQKQVRVFPHPDDVIWRPDLAETATQLRLLLDRAEDFQVSAGCHLSELLSTKFDSNLAPLRIWYEREVDEIDKWHLAWFRIMAYIGVKQRAASTSEPTSADSPTNADTRRGPEVNPNDIIVGERLRPLNAEKVEELERSITALGLGTPITIRYVEGRPILIAGAHRLQAVKNLGWDQIAVRKFEGDDRAARMWEISENLHRAELTVLERSEQTAEWMRLAAEGQPGQVDPAVLSDGRKAGPQHQEGGINRASRDLGIDRKAAQRSAKIDALAPEAKETARELGLDDNQSALLEAAKGETADEQVEALKQRKDRKQPQPAAANGAGVNIEPVTSAARFSLRDLPFAAALAVVKEWFAALPISQQSLVLAALESANDTVGVTAEPVAA